jgi:hypothetical protein
VPTNVPYLFADAALVEHWRGQLPPTRTFRVGIVWQGNPGYRKDNLRSIPLAAFAPLAQLEGVELCSLQKGPGTEQLAAAPFPVTDLGARLHEQGGAFTDTAAVLHSLDLVVAPDTALAHLAGGLGVPVFVALSPVPDWRWLLGRDDSPWYPSAQLFRRAEGGGWGSVFERIAAGVAERAGAKRGVTP